MVSRREIIRNLTSGFLDQSIQSSREYHPALLANNPEKQEKVLTTVQEQLLQCESFWVSVAFITTSGVASLINVLEQLRDNKIHGKILASQYQNFTHPEALRRLSRLSNIELRISVDRNFHAKGYLFRKADCYSLIIGSSNLTANALSKNAEWNLKVSAAHDSALMEQTLEAFKFEFEHALPVDQSFIDQYAGIYKAAEQMRLDNGSLPLPPIYRIADTSWSPQHTDPTGLISGELRRPTFPHIVPNTMQKEALANLDRIRSDGHNRALIVSATGTGKTFLAAFDTKAFGARRTLFVVHRRNIAEAAKTSFETVFGETRTTGIYSGAERSEADFLFCTIQTLSKPEHLERFKRDHFDYIVIDESHRAGADSYKRVIDYFKPRFLLGMTATPERTDGFDIFSLFNHQIAYEIRLHQALEEEMLSPFHYYGVTDLAVDDVEIDEEADFNRLTSTERVERIIEKSMFYGTDSGETRALVFCSRREECDELARQFNRKDIPALSLTGLSSEPERDDAIRRLESNDHDERLEYVFTVDIFNEGVDIPRVNQVIMLRPTQSAIIFVQQMGRGLRKVRGKEYLTIIDFIGNYKNNFLIPVALYGDRTYNKDHLRKLINGGSSSIPGTSTINFDKISKERIYKAIDAANMKRLAELKKDYDLLKFELGHPPMMVDFLEHGTRDPFLYVEYQKSFFNFSARYEESLKDKLSTKQRVLLEAFSREINNAVRIEESLILKLLFENETVTTSHVIAKTKERYGFGSQETVESAIHGLNLRFVRAKQNGEMKPLAEIFDVQVTLEGVREVSLHPDFRSHLSNSTFEKYLIDSAEYSIRSFDATYRPELYRDGFQLYRKYSRKDVFRILNWKTNPVAQNVGGYILSEDGSNCPIFVTYHKDEDISNSIKYEDYLVNRNTFAWMSKSNRTLQSNDVKAIKQSTKSGMRIPLFVKKSDDEGNDFYYIGDVDPVQGSFQQTRMLNDNEEEIPVVKLEFRLRDPVEESMYRYLTEERLANIGD